MITPIEIENKEFKKGIRGYNQDEVDEFLDMVKEDFEQLYRENLELKEKVSLKFIRLTFFAVIVLLSYP